MKDKGSVAVSLILVAALGLLTYGERSLKSAKGQRVPPAVISKTRGAGVFIESIKLDEKANLLVVTVRNDTDREVTDYLIKCGAATKGTHGSTYAGQRPAIAAYSSDKTVCSTLDSDVLNSPVVLTSAAFVDGTMLGDDADVGELRRTRQKVLESNAKACASAGAF